MTATTTAKTRGTARTTRATRGTKAKAQAAPEAGGMPESGKGGMPESGGTTCGCGCGDAVTSKSRFRAGHDARLVGQVARDLIEGNGEHTAAVLQIDIREGMSARDRLDVAGRAMTKQFSAHLAAKMETYAYKLVDKAQLRKQQAEKAQLRKQQAEARKARAARA